MENRNLKQNAYEILLNKLINCEFMPQSVLNETQISHELGFSRTPIREALIRLENEGYVQIIPKKGIYVKGISLTQVREIFQARSEIEPIALKMAGPYLPREELEKFHNKFSGDEPDVLNGFSLDTQMHLFIVEHCGNHFIIDMMHEVFNNNTRVVIASKQDKVKIHDARQEHLKILSFLLDKNYEKASEAMRIHIQSCQRATMNYFYNEASGMGSVSEGTQLVHPF